MVTMVMIHHRNYLQNKIVTPIKSSEQLKGLYKREDICLVHPNQNTQTLLH